MAKFALKDLARQLLVERDRARIAFERADQLLDAILQRKKAGERIPLGDGRTIVLIDNFRDRLGNSRNMAFKSVGIRRFDIEVINE